MNVVILISVLSVGNSSIYASSRTLAALADQHQAPQFLSYIDRKGRPIWSICVASALGLLCFLAASDKQTEAFLWMVAISGLSCLFTWGSVCLCHIRFRRGWKVQGHSLDELTFRSQPGVIGSWVGFLFICLVLVTQFWIGVAPVGYETMSSMEVAKSFFSSYLAAPIVILFYIPYKLIFRTKFIRSKEMDLVTGRRDMDIRHVVELERAEQAQWPAWKRVYKWFC